MRHSVFNACVVIILLGAAVVVARGGYRAVFGNRAFYFHNSRLAVLSRGDKICAFKAVKRIFPYVGGGFVAPYRTLPHAEQGGCLLYMPRASGPVVRVFVIICGVTERIGFSYVFSVSESLGV